MAILNIYFAIFKPFAGTYAWKYCCVKSQDHSTAYIVHLYIYKVLKHIKLCIIMYQSLNFNIRLVAYIATSYNKNLNKDNQ